MKINLANVTCTDEKAYNRLLDYLVKIGNYKNFDSSMPVVVYVNDEFDLIGFESPKYRIQYVNNAHKLYELIQSRVTVDPVPFNELKSHLLAIGSTSNNPF